MKVTVNGNEREFAPDRSMKLSELLKDLGLAGHPVVVELNGMALLPAEHANSIVADGDSLEVVRVVAGG